MVRRTSTASILNFKGGPGRLCLLRWLGLSRSGQTCMSPLTSPRQRCVRMTKRTRWGYYDGRDGPPTLPRPAGVLGPSFCFCSILIVCSGLVRYGGGAPVRAARTPIALFALTAGGIRSNSGSRRQSFGWVSWSARGPRSAAVAALCHSIPLQAQPIRDDVMS